MPKPFEEKDHLELIAEHLAALHKDLDELRSKAAESYQERRRATEATIAVLSKHERAIERLHPKKPWPRSLIITGLTLLWLFGVASGALLNCYSHGCGPFMQSEKP